MATQQYVSMQVWQPIQRKPSLISLPAPGLSLPNISQYLLLPSPPCPALPCLATPAGVFGTPPLWDSPPLSAADTPFFCPHTFISPRLTLPHLPCHVCVRVILGGWCQEFPEIGTSSCRALWPRNDKMVYNILVHYKPFYSGQYRDKVLTKAV